MFLLILMILSFYLKPPITSSPSSKEHLKFSLWIHGIISLYDYITIQESWNQDPHTVLYGWIGHDQNSLIKSFTQYSIGLCLYMQVFCCCCFPFHYYLFWFNAILLRYLILCHYLTSGVNFSDVSGADGKRLFSWSLKLNGTYLILHFPTNIWTEIQLSRESQFSPSDITFKFKIKCKMDVVGGNMTKRDIPLKNNIQRLIFIKDKCLKTICIQIARKVNI